jgi:hypothetical protein
MNKQIKTALIISTLASLVIIPAFAQGFQQGIQIMVDGDLYYLAGPPSINDVPGHYWVKAGPNKLVGKHYNTGPPGTPFESQGWSSDAPDGELLYKVDAIIDTWSPAKAERYASRGYVHYHELAKVNDGTLHPSKVVWLKHTARTSFTLDGGPAAWPPSGPIPYLHTVTPGVDYEFPNNYLIPYP